MWLHWTKVGHGCLDLSSLFRFTHINLVWTRVQLQRLLLSASLNSTLPTILLQIHGTLQGAIKVYDVAKKNGLKPILGIEGYLRSDDCPILNSFGIAKDDKGTTKNYLKYSHITLHAQDQEAYQNLGRILSRANKNRSERHGSELKGIFSGKIWKNWVNIISLVVQAV